MTGGGGAEEGGGGEGFLARWSRRKRAAAAGSAPTVAPAGLPGLPEERAVSPRAQAAASAASQARAPLPAAGARQASSPVDDRQPSPAAVPGIASAVPSSAEASPPRPAAFDPAALPPVESLTAESDIRDFLRAEVPPALRRAALRRIWALDPAIRDFVGPADYAWDYNAPDGIPGFAPMLAKDAARQLLARAAAGPEERQPPREPVSAESRGGCDQSAGEPQSQPAHEEAAPSGSALAATAAPGTEAMADTEAAAEAGSDGMADRTTGGATCAGGAVGGARPSRRHGGAIPA